MGYKLRTIAHQNPNREIMCAFPITNIFSAKDFLLQIFILKILEKCISRGGNFRLDPIYDSKLAQKKYDMNLHD